MALDLTTILGGLGATAMAFADPQQSLLMSQGIMRRNQQIQDRKRREEQQRRELMLEQQKIAMQQAQMRQQAMQQQAAAQMLAQQLDPNAGSQLASVAPAVWRPGQAAGVPANPMQEAAMTRTAINDPTGQTPFPFVPQPTLKPGVFSGTQGQQRGRLPQHALAHARTLQALGNTEGAAKVLADAAEQRRKEAMPPEPTARMRNWAFGQGLPEGQRQEFLRQGGVNVTNVIGDEEQLSPAEYSTWGQYKADPGKRFLYDEETGEPILVEGVDPLTGAPFKTHRQVSISRKDPGAEETRFLALGRSVLDKSNQIERVLEEFDNIDMATYGVSQAPFVGQFFSDTTGGRFNTLVGQLVTDSLYQVSGSEAPPREIKMRYELYAPKPWDSSATIRWKLENLKSLSRYALEYRLNQRLDNDEVLSPEQMDALLLGHDREFARMRDVPPVPPMAPPSGFSYSGWDPQRKLHVYTNESGQEKFARPVE